MSRIQNAIAFFFSLYALRQLTDARFSFFFLRFSLKRAFCGPSKLSVGKKASLLSPQSYLLSLRSHRLPTSTRASLSEGLREEASRSDASSAESRTSSAGGFKAGFQHSSSSSS